MSVEADPTEADPREHPLCEHCGDYHPRWEYQERTTQGTPILACPTCGREFQPVARTTVFQELFVAISGTRRGDHAEKMARVLQHYEQGTRELVGLAQNGNRALYCNTEAKTLVSVAFDKHGVYAVEDTLSRNVRDVEAWIDARGDDLEWVHPQYGSDTTREISDTFRYRKRGVQKANATRGAE
jgi:hypothetical protein